MSIGANQGGNLNILVFEVGVVTTDPVLGTEVVTTVSVHPLVVAPRSIRYQDTSRSPIMETTGGSIVTVAGRALRSVTLDGSFGVESRGLAAYLGTGEVRFQRFYKEVVRMSEALTAGDVQAAVDALNGTPFIGLLVRPFVEGQSTFYINFYDFWHGVAFQCRLASFAWSREFRNGGATGNIPYNMLVKEVGPIKEGGLGNTIISGLLAVLGTWDDLNEVVASYTATAILDAGVGLLAIPVSEFADTVEAMYAQVQAVQELMGGNTSASLTSSAANDGITSFFANCARVETAGIAAVTALNQAIGSGEFENTAGAISPEFVSGEGSNRTLDLYDQVIAVEGVRDAAAFYRVSGVFFGMSRDDYQAFVLGGGILGLLGPDVLGSTRYTVSITDTPASLEQQFGVSWARILELNGMTPDEALFPGTEIQVPTSRPRGAPGIQGLPTFGSHIGEAAWGVDVTFDLAVDEDGRLLMVSGEDVLVQGVQFLVEQFSDSLLRAVQSVPEAARTSYLSRRLAALFKLDGRFSTTEDVAVSLDPAGGFDVEATLHAINGGTITTGGSS